MIWTQEVREYFFGVKPVVEITCDDQETEMESDRAFNMRYCSARTQRAIIIGKLELKEARKALRFLSERIPSGRHTTPGWSLPTDELPLVSIGYAILQNRLRRPTIVLRDTCIGLCARNKQLFLWADTKSLDAFCQSSRAYCTFRSAWRDWRVNKSLQIIPLILTNQGELLDGTMSQINILDKFLEFIDNKISLRQQTQSYQQLMQTFVPCRQALGDPSEWQVIYPRLSSSFDEQLSEDDSEGVDTSVPAQQLASQQLSPKQRRKRKLQSPIIKDSDSSSSKNLYVSDSPIDFGSSCSMLEILRRVAIARVRTVLPTFDDRQLDEWILDTGSNSSHEDTADLFFLYAASITNAGGIKPNHQQFGGLIGEAIKPYVVANKLSSVPQDIQSLAKDCLPYLDRYSLGGQFNEDIKTIAQSGSGRILMCRLLASVNAFAQWLNRYYAGSAKVLHVKLMTAPTLDTITPVVTMLCDLTTLPQMGVATAANFLKDSQATGLQALKLGPRSAAAHLAGWFAKPDLHVARLMAYITGRAPQPGQNPQHLKLGSALALFYSEADPAFSNNYSALQHNDAPDLRVICDIHAWANACKTSALEIDRVLYLIGVRKTIVNACLVQAPWYSKFVATVDQAISRGVSRQS
jgi:hypothetical protein